MTHGWCVGSAGRAHAEAWRSVELRAVSCCTESWRATCVTHWVRTLTHWRRTQASWHLMCIAWWCMVTVHNHASPHAAGYSNDVTHQTAWGRVICAQRRVDLFYIWHVNEAQMSAKWDKPFKCHYCICLRQHTQVRIPSTHHPLRKKFATHISLKLCLSHLKAMPSFIWYFHPGVKRF